MRPPPVKLCHQGSPWCSDDPKSIHVQCRSYEGLTSLCCASHIVEMLSALDGRAHLQLAVRLLEEDLRLAARSHR